MSLSPAGGRLFCACLPASDYFEVMANLRYLLGAMVAIPLLPLMAWQGKRIRAAVPSLPEAVGPEGISGQGEGKPLRLITIGESTIAGVGAGTHEEGFNGSLAKDLAKMLNRTVSWRVYARSGYTARLVRERLLPKIDPGESPDLIVIGLGGNDSFTLNRPWQWQKDITALVDSLKDRFGIEVPIVFMNMPPIKEFPAFTSLIQFVVGNLVEVLGESLEQIVQDMPNVWFANERISMDVWIERVGEGLGMKDFFSDGVHPSLLTYQTWAKEMAAFIVREVYADSH